jgi:diguanylate cyclase (GGDEF)-like protein
MEVKPTKKILLSDDDPLTQYLDLERRLRAAELDKIDLVQSARLVFNTIGLLLTRRGYNNDLVNIVTKMVSRLGSEKNSLELFDQAASEISGLAGHDTFVPPINRVKDEPPNGEMLEVTIKEVINDLIHQLSGFKDNSYHNSTEVIKNLLEQNSPLENIFPVLVDLCQRILYDYDREKTNINNRLNSIISMLLFMESEYFKFIDNSIINYDNKESSFNNNLVTGLGEIQRTFKDKGIKLDAENLINELSFKIEGLLLAVQKKSEEDAKLVDSLNHEKEQLKTRLDKVRREHDNFVSESHKALAEFETIKSISLRDSLTKVYNRRAFDEQISMTIEKFVKGNLSTLSLIIFDIDFFREVNNNYGHQAGDSILSNVGRLIKECLRNDDFIFRYGGDEFIILLPEASLSDGVKVAEKVRLQMEVVEFRLHRQSERNIHITISVGVTQAKKGDSANSVLARADRALYISKKDGRNKVSTF